MNAAGQPGDRQAAEPTTLAEFRETVGSLTPEERDEIISQAMVLIDQLYVHLPLKRAMHAVDPVQRLRVLRRRVAPGRESITDRQFHDEMIAVFTGLRDLHTRYVLPRPYRGWTAILPFRVRAYEEEGQRRYVVTRTVPHLIADPDFCRGVRVTSWNGAAMDRAVALNADRQPGSNADARYARGLNTMTKRPLETSAMPSEDWVHVGWQHEDGRRGELRLEWRVVRAEPAPTAVDPRAADEPLALALGLDHETEAVRRSRKTVFDPEGIRTEKEFATLAEMSRSDSSGELPGLGGVSVFPDALEFATRTGSRGEFGYLRIRTFLVRHVRLFVMEVMRILGQLPQRGLIVDVRGNPGGVIKNGELLLQLFTPHRIQPERMHFINTLLTRELCDRVSELKPWKDSIADSVLTATPFSDGFPLTSEQECNAVGQVYHGPIVLLTDALCYSATDIFVAGWRDHAIGPILGTCRNTGAGGANVWDHAVLLKCFGGADSPIKPLPQDASFSLAIRRTTRVGERSGDPLEDLGVSPDYEHPLTLEDLRNGYVDLLERAEQILAEQPMRAFAVDARRTDDGRGISVKVDSVGVDRIDVYVNDRPRHTLDVPDREVTFEVPAEEGTAARVELKGFERDTPVAARRLTV